MIIKDILEYAKSLVGIKYTWWKSGSTTKEIYPFYVDTVPSIDYIKKYGINCTGLINLLRQMAGKDIPGNGIYRGGTDQWFKFLKKKKVLHKFDDSQKYPIGTLFLRKYRNVEDQGHVAIYITESKHKNKPLYGKIIHAHFAHDDIEKNGVEITSFGWSHFWVPEGYYEYAILPSDWLFLE